MFLYANFDFFEKIVLRLLNVHKAPEIFLNSDSVVVEEIPFAEKTLVSFHFFSIILKVNTLFINLVETHVLDVFDFFEFFELLFVEFKQQKLVDVIPFCVFFCVRKLSEWLDVEPGAAFDFIGDLKLETATGKVALNLKPQHCNFGFVVIR